MLSCPLTGEPPARVSSPGNGAVSIGSHVRQFAVLSWAGGSRHLRTALLLVCRALSGKSDSALFCIDQDLSDVLPWDVTSSRESSGSGWSVNRGSCIFNVPISPWHDLHLLKFFLASIFCFRQRPEGNDPSLPSSLPPLPPPLPHGGCGRGVGWRQYNLIRPAATRRFLALVYSGDTRLVVVSFTTSLFFCKKKGESFELPNDDVNKVPVSHPYYTAPSHGLPRLYSRDPHTHTHSPLWSVCPSRSTIRKKSESFELSNDDA